MRRRGEEICLATFTRSMRTCGRPVRRVRPVRCGAQCDLPEMMRHVTSVAEPEVRVAAGAPARQSTSWRRGLQGHPVRRTASAVRRTRGVEAWEGRRDALSYGPPPPQPGLFGMDASAVSAAGWLTVSVWTPDLAAALPVSVLIQGCGYVFGTSALPEYDGSRLAREVGVVVVTFKYRVGIEGLFRSTAPSARPGRRVGVSSAAAPTRSRCSASPRVVGPWRH